MSQTLGEPHEDLGCSDGVREDERVVQGEEETNLDQGRVRRSTRQPALREDRRQLTGCGGYRRRSRRRRCRRRDPAGDGCKSDGADESGLRAHSDGSGPEAARGVGEPDGCVVEVKDPRLEGQRAMVDCDVERGGFARVNEMNECTRQRCQMRDLRGIEVSDGLKLGC